MHTPSKVDQRDSGGFVKQSANSDIAGWTMDGDQGSSRHRVPPLWLHIIVRFPVGQAVVLCDPLLTVKAHGCVTPRW